MDAKRARDNNTENTNDLTLYVEDHDFSREQVVESLRDKDYHNIIAPNSLADCSTVATHTHFARAIIDNNLSNWVGNNETPIRVGEFECSNGLELARALKNQNSSIKIGLFSSHRGELIRQLENAPEMGFIEILEEMPALPNQHIIKFVEKFYNLNLQIKPLFKKNIILPYGIQTFYARKIIEQAESKENYWKAGNYLWLVSINGDLPDARFKEIEELYKDVSENPAEEFLIVLDRNGLPTTKRNVPVEAIFNKTTNEIITLKDISHNIINYTPDNFVHLYFIIYAVCEKYLSKEFDTNETVLALKALIGRVTEDNQKMLLLLESQKILYKSLSHSAGKGSKEEIYELLNKFSINGFLKIFDVYECMFESLDQNTAHVRMESCSPEKIIRYETFSAEFLSQNNIDENSRFEYTIYEPAIGGHASHIQPT